MKISAEIYQLRSQYNGGLFNVDDFQGMAIGVWGIPTEIYLFREIGAYGQSFVVSTNNIDSFLEYLAECRPGFLRKYELIGSLKELRKG